MTDAKKVSMTEEELAEFVKVQIAEDRSRREVAASVPVPFTPIPPGPEPISDELAAEFGKALDATRGNVNEATGRILARIQTYPRNSGDLIERPVDPPFRALFTQWYWVKESMPLMWPDLIRNVLSNIQRKREREKVA